MSKQILKNIIFLVFWVLASIILSVFLLYLNRTYVDNEILREIIMTILIAVLSTLILSVIWKYIMNKKMFNEFMSIAGVSNSIIENKIMFIADDFTNVNLVGKILKSKECTLVFTYSAPFLSVFKDKLRYRIAWNKLSITVVLPNYNDDKILEQISRKFNGKDKSTIKTKIEETAKGFKEINANVLLFNDYHFNNAYYSFEESSIITTIHHRNKGCGKCIVLEVMNDSKIGDYIHEEVASIIEQSSEFHIATKGERNG